MFSFVHAPRIAIAALVGLSLASSALAQKSHQYDFDAAISIPAGAPVTTTGPASIYPASVAVSGINAPIGEVKVVLRTLSHSWLADVDMLLVGPGGQSALLLNRVGSTGPGVSNFQYILTQDGNKYPIYGVPQPGRYRPTQNPGFPPVLNAPAPAGPYGQTLDTFKGTSANGVWSLYIADNNNSDSGSLSGWSLIIDEAKSFGNDRSVTIPGGAPGTTSGPAEVYPSTVLVDGLEGQVRSVRVMLTALTHTYQADVRMMLQSPGGQTCLFYGNCGDSTNWTASDVIFDDTAATAMPSNLPVAPGVYRPTVCTNAGVNFAAPAPAAPYGTTLSVFNGSNPNGAWRLWIEDSYNNDYGALTGGWSLIINGQTCPADYNKDGVIGIQDIFDFLNGWFAGCP